MSPTVGKLDRRRVGQIAFVVLALASLVYTAIAGDVVTAILLLAALLAAVPFVWAPRRVLPKPRI